MIDINNCDSKARPFQIGDQVVVRSGGPVMTVLGFHSKVFCQWADDPESIAEFSESVLVKVDEPDPAKKVENK